MNLARQTRLPDKTLPATLLPQAGPSGKKFPTSTSGPVGISPGGSLSLGGFRHLVVEILGGKEVKRNGGVFSWKKWRGV